MYATRHAAVVIVNMHMLQKILNFGVRPENRAHHLRHLTAGNCPGME
jgi:hypothetical protein